MVYVTFKYHNKPPSYNMWSEKLEQRTDRHNQAAHVC